jgi:hypothetical protein
MKKLSLIFPILMTILLAAGSSAVVEEEPNDSMDQPQLIGEGTVTGSVNGTGDSDIFRAEIPADNVVFYSVKKTDTDSGVINVKAFDSERQTIPFDEEESDNIAELSISGEICRVFLVNSNSPDRFFIAVSGSGQYEVEVLFEETGDPEDAPGMGESPGVLEDGDEVSGRVFELEYGYLEYSDVDRYEISSDTEVCISVHIRRTDSGNGTLYASLDQNPSARFKEAEFDRMGEVITLEECIYPYGEEETVYLTIWGEGEYEIEVMIEDDSFSENVFLGVMGFFLCFYLMIFIVPILGFVAVIFIVVWLIVKGNKDKDRVAEKRRGRKGPGMVTKVPKSPPG